MTILFDIVVTIIVLILLNTFHDEIAHIFTKDVKTVTIINDVLYVLTFYIFFDTIHGVQSGIIRGLG